MMHRLRGWIVNYRIYRSHRRRCRIHSRLLRMRLLQLKSIETVDKCRLIDASYGREVVVVARGNHSIRHFFFCRQLMLH